MIWLLKIVGDCLKRIGGKNEKCSEKNKFIYDNFNNFTFECADGVRNADSTF